MVDYHNEYNNVFCNVSKYPSKNKFQYKLLKCIKDYNKLFLFDNTIIRYSYFLFYFNIFIIDDLSNSITEYLMQHFDNNSLIPYFSVL